MRLALMPNNVQARPTPADQDDASRVLHSAIRHRMLDGEWERDGIDMLKNHVGDRADAWGVLDMSSCPADQIASEAAVLYVRPPKASCDQGDVTDLVGDHGLARRAGLWTKMKEVQRYNWFLREYLVRIDLDADRKALGYRLVSPHDVIAKADPEEPDRPVRIEELRLRDFYDEDGNVVSCWTRDLLDISDPENPIYRVERWERGWRDYTAQVLGQDYSGKNYPYRRKDNTPILPYVLYHARDTGKLWNTRDGVAVMIGSLNAAVYWTMAGHGAKDASGRTVIVAGAELQGVESKRSTEQLNKPVRTISLEPGTICFLEGVGGQIVIQEVGPGAQLKDLEDFAMGYERRVAVLAGVNPSDIQRVGGDSRSGYAIAISNQGKRRMQEEQTELYRRYDLELLEKSAIICNALLGTKFPEGGYNVEYQPIPKTPEEQTSEREEIDFDLRNNVISGWEAVRRRRPGLTEDEAKLVYMHNADEKSVQAATAKAQDTALNGAQIAAAVSIAQSFKAGEISRQAAFQILQRSFAMDDPTANKFLA